MFEDEAGSMKMDNISMVAAGIDTGKHYLDIALCPGGESLRLPNTAAGQEQLLAWLASRRVERIGIEASGGYERTVVERLRAGGLAVALLQPRQVRAFATFRLRRGKSDRIDAALIAQCVASLGELRPAKDPRLDALSEHLRLIEQIEADIVRAKTRRETYRDARIQRLQDRAIARLQTQLKAELALLLKRLTEHDDLARRLDLAHSVDGVGRRTALALVILLPELGCLTREQAAALAGLAPFVRESGTYKGQRRIGGGRGRVRRALYNAALAAAFRWNDALNDFYGRLRSHDKPHRKALTACARKLLIYVNAVVQRDTPWTKPASPALNGC